MGQAARCRARQWSFGCCLPPPPVEKPASWLATAILFDIMISPLRLLARGHMPNETGRTCPRAHMARGSPVDEPAFNFSGPFESVKFWLLAQLQRIFNLTVRNCLAIDKKMASTIFPGTCRRYCVKTPYGASIQPIH